VTPGRRCSSKPSPPSLISWGCVSWRKGWKTAMSSRRCSP
jgi:hypothetical protein